MNLAMDRVYKRLEDYGIIGNLETCALVGNDGSIDWCCFPHLESPSVFAAILDAEKGGHFRICPKYGVQAKQSYLEDTNILQTTFQCESGTVVLTDFMPVIEGSYSDASGIVVRAILRKIECTSGSVEMQVDFKPRFDYARVMPDLRLADSGIEARWNDQKLFLQSPFPFEIYDGGASGVFTIKEGETIWFILQYGSNKIMSPERCKDHMEKTTNYWLEWAHDCESSQCVFDGPWHEIVVRSGLVLKLLTHPEIGTVAAAPTTSLPEEVGGVRNWDYRFSWIRDSSFTVQALYNLGHVQEAKAYLRWFMKVCRHEYPSDIQVLYGMHGERKLEEQELVHLSGYRNSRPVRIGNAAARQTQLDIYGELINTVYEISRYGEDVSAEDWYYVRRIVDYVCQIWNTKDSGIWEVRSEPKHFVYSKLMCWVALDRGIKIAKLKGFEAPLGMWEKNRDELKNSILERGFNRKLNSFVRYFDADELDASCLLIPLMEFLPFGDSRVQGTIDATMKRLMSEKGLLYRYEGEDGLDGEEGTFVLCTFWLVNVLTLSGRVEEAERILLSILEYVSPLGLLAEEIDTKSHEQLGNFPQAFSHIGLINSALYLGMARGKKQIGPEPVGTGSRRA